MNLIETIIGIVLILLIVITFITEPAISVKYYNAVWKSGVKIFTWTFKQIKGLTVEGDIDGNNNRAREMGKIPE